VPILTNDPPRMRTALLIGIPVLAACGRPAAPPGPAPPETARLAPATARFHLVEHRHIEQRYLEQVIDRRRDARDSQRRHRPAPSGLRWRDSSMRPATPAWPRRSLRRRRAFG
jgi:hypothetical protein